MPLIAVIGIFLFGHNALAAPDWAISIVSGILGVFIWALGVILILVIKGLILIASYQNFIGSAAVTLGWVIVRDVCNMFFVIVLLIIAFGTILHLENYNYKKWLPKLILMAILINFSKTICGLLIDASQIIMLTFVNAFKDVGGANLTDILGLSKIVTMAKDDSSISLWTVVGAYVLGIIYLMIAVVVIITMMMMLVMRLVMIWIYVVLSPLAYLLSAFPGGQKYASQWWDEFTKNLIVGPVLAFFIWLSFAALQTYTKDTTADQSTAAEIAKTGDVGVGSSTAAVAATEASSPASLIQFVIAIGMLLGGLKISQEIGGMAGSMAGKGMGRIQKGTAFATGVGAGVLATARRKTVAGARTVGGTVLGGIDRTLGAGVDKLTSRPGQAQVTNLANKGLFTTVASGLKNAPGNISTRLSSTFNRNKELDEKRREFLEEEKKGNSSAVMSFGGKQYKKDQTNQFYEVDDKGQAVPQRNAQGNPIANSRSYLTTGQPGKQQRVKAMGEMTAAWHDAWRASGSQSKAAANKAQEEKISKEQTKISDSGQTTDEMRRALMSGSTAAAKKMALAMTLAIKGGFKDKKEVAEAKKYLGSNTLLQGKFNDDVDKNQPHLNYDLSINPATGGHANESDVARFKSRIDQGKIDSTRLSPETFSAPNSGAVDILRDYHGADFGRVLEANFKKNKRSGDAVSAALLASRKPVNGQLNADKDAQLHAKLTGKIEDSFTINNNLDTSALSQYLSSAKSGDLNKINAADINNAPSPQIQNDLKDALVNNLNFAKLKAMHRQGDNPDLVKLVIKHAQAQAPANPNNQKIQDLNNAINSDPELKTI